MKIYINKMGAGFDVFVETKPETYVSFNNKKAPVMAAISFLEHQLQPIVICCSDETLWFDLVQQEFVEHKDSVVDLMGLDTNNNEYFGFSSDIRRNSKSCHLYVKGEEYNNNLKKPFKIRRYDIQLETETEQRRPAFYTA